MSAKLYVGNLDFNMTEEQIEMIFARVGTVASVKIVRDPFDRRSKGFAFVTMATDQDAEKAINTLNGFEITGRGLKVASAHSNDARLGPKTYNHPGS